jgi:nucleolar protein 56
MIIVTKWFGVFLCDKEKVRRHTLFEKDPKAIAQKLALVQRGEILPEEQAFAGKRVLVADPRLSKLGRPVVYDSSYIKGEDYGYPAELMQQVMVELGKVRTREPIRPDRHVVQAIRAIDDLNEAINVMSERLHEWYGLHFPELADYAKELEYARLIAEKGQRDEVMKALDLHLESVGAELLENDVDVLREVAAALTSFYKAKEDLEKYVSVRMQETAPNLTALLSANLGARLISLAGGLQRLATLPSSTVQLLGAEKAMFMHLRSGKAPPKHGIIFQHPAIHRAPYWQRGKVSRSLAAKAAIAARVDFYKGEFIGERLKAEMERRVEEITKKYPEPPKRQRAPQQQRGHRPGQYKRG